MKQLWIAVGGFVVLVLIAAVVKKVLGGGGWKLPYERKPNFMTAAERAFYGVLCRAAQAAGLDVVVMAQVPISAMIQVRRGMGKDWRMWFNKINCKTVDFVLLDAGTLAVVAAVELDDRSHERADRRERDALVEQAMEAAGVKLVRVKCRRTYRIDEVAAEIQRVLSEG